MCFHRVLSRTGWAHRSKSCTVDDVDPGFGPQFDGLLKSPSGILTVQNVVHESLLTISLSGQIVRVRVWLNHPRWADKVAIGVIRV